VDPGACHFVPTGSVDVSMSGWGTDAKDVVERFVRDVRRRGDAVTDVRVEVGTSVGRTRITRIRGEAVSFSDARCKELAAGGVPS
jgi:hypothetical protein